ncbi:MAG: adenylate/guanylate cyclase domain-containing protein [Pseudomonadota bacterium]
MAADVVGYSRLMAADEAGTLAALRAHRKDLFNPEIEKRSGRIVKLMGDGTLVEFPSLVDAVEAALAIQQRLSAESGPIQLRIGINLGDVILEGEDIYGDGVNVASRLEALAEPGGICISFVVHESLGNRIDVGFTDDGEHKVKNIDRPIHVFRWPAREPTGVSRLELIPAEAKQDHTISVTRFENLSNDEELGFFCEGVCEDIITAFGNVDQLTVLAEGHDGKQEKAHYLLTGKVRKSGSRIRVSSQLNDSHTGIQRWAGRYDRDASDLFDVQDDVTRNIVIAVHAELGSGSYHNRWQWGTEDF